MDRDNFDELKGSASSEHSEKLFLLRQFDAAAPKHATCRTRLWRR
jgi:hypothetical protein